MTTLAASHTIDEAPRRRRAPNEARFPVIVNVAVSQQIGDAIGALRQSYAGLGYTSSDVVRLALFEWLSAKGAIQPSNGKHQQHQGVAHVG